MSCFFVSLRARSERVGARTPLHARRLLGEPFGSSQRRRPSRFCSSSGSSPCFYDLGLLVVTVAGADVLGRGTLTALMLANPASVFRLLNQSVIGVLSFRCRPLRSLSGILAAWIAVLFAICARTLAVRRL